MRAVENSGYYDRISEKKEDYAGDISFAIVKGDEVSSLILFEKLSNGDLHMMMFSGKATKASKELLSLLEYTAVCFYRNYPEKTKIILTLESERSLNLATHVFPEKDAGKIRRGIFY